jgi:hypothetical protein
MLVLVTLAPVRIECQRLRTSPVTLHGTFTHKARGRPRTSRISTQKKGPAGPGVCQHQQGSAHCRLRGPPAWRLSLLAMLREDPPRSRGLGLNEASSSHGPFAEPGLRGRRPRCAAMRQHARPSTGIRGPPTEKSLAAAGPRILPASCPMPWPMTRGSSDWAPYA